jgi:hypothetical protein
MSEEISLTLTICNHPIMTMINRVITGKRRIYFDKTA